MNPITNSGELKKFCLEIANESFITIDTEFIREETYFPRLCLIQVASSKNITLIDPIALNMDLVAFLDILLNPKIRKVFHSGKQDLEIILKLFGVLPCNFFDTQIAAAFCGFGISVSYENIVKALLNINIDKSYCLSDWSHRPLALEQLNYAAIDVKYLRSVYEILYKELEENGLLTWAIEDMDNLNKPDSVLVNIDQVWKRIKAYKPNLHHFEIIKALASWREKKAQLYDVPRNRIIKDHIMLEIAEKLPITIKELKQISSTLVADSFFEEIVFLVKNNLEKQTIKLIESTEASSSLKTNKSFYKIKEFIELKAKEFNLPVELIASSSDIKSIRDGDYKVKTMHGWRLKLIEGFLNNL